MKHLRSTSVVVFVVVVLSVVASPVAADTHTPATNTPTGTGTETPTSTPTASDTTSGECVQVDGMCIPSFRHQVDDVTRVVAVDWSADRIPVVIHSDTIQRITLVNQGSIGSSGAGDVTYTAETVQPGLNVVYIPSGDVSGDVTITVGTSQDLDWISDPQQPFLKDGIQTSLVYIAAIGGSLGSVAIASLWALYRWYRLNNSWTDVITEFSP